MKTSTVGLVFAAILMVLAGVGFGIAQAGGNYTDGPVLSFGDQEAYEQSIVPGSYTEDRPVLAFEDEMQARGMIGTGNLPEMSNADSSIVEIEQDKYREGGDIGP
jgi:hypothetical protein